MNLSEKNDFLYEKLRDLSNENAELKAQLKQAQEQITLMQYEFEKYRESRD